MKLTKLRQFGILFVVGILAAPLAGCGDQGVAELECRQSVTPTSEQRAIIQSISESGRYHYCSVDEDLLVFEKRGGAGLRVKQVDVGTVYTVIDEDLDIDPSKERMTSLLNELKLFDALDRVLTEQYVDKVHWSRPDLTTIPFSNSCSMLPSGCQ